MKRSIYVYEFYKVHIILFSTCFLCASSLSSPLFHRHFCVTVDIQILQWVLVVCLLKSKVQYTSWVAQYNVRSQYCVHIVAGNTLSLSEISTAVWALFYIHVYYIYICSVYIVRGTRIWCDSLTHLRKPLTMAILC